MDRARTWPAVARFRSRYAAVAIVMVVAVVAVLWSLTLFRGPADSGSLDARVTAVGATVRCPICKYPIPLNDVQNAEAVQMRQFIRDRLQLGRSEDLVRQDLVARYGTDILLAPPQRGFDLLIWLVPFCALAACASAVLIAAWRWSRGNGPPSTTADDLPVVANPEMRRYEEQLDRELAARE